MTTAREARQTREARQAPVDEPRAWCGCLWAEPERREQIAREGLSTRRPMPGWTKCAALIISCLAVACSGSVEDAQTDGDTAEMRGLRPQQAWTTLGPEQFGGAGAVKDLGDRYLEAYLRFFPSRATASGFYDHDGQLEDFSAERLESWFSHASAVLSELPSAASSDCEGQDETLACKSSQVDAELLRREIELHLLDWQERNAPRQKPTLWTGVASSSTVYFLVRADRPLEQRVGFVIDRLRLIPGLMAQATETLALGDPAAMSALDCGFAAGQARSLAGFYRERLIDAAALPQDQHLELLKDLETAGTAAAQALDGFAEFAAGLEGKATGSPVLGADLYARRFALYTGLSATPAEVLASAEEALEQQLDEADRHAMAIWKSHFDQEPPTDRRERVRALFLALGDDRAASVEEFVVDYRTLVENAEAFVKEHDIVSTPDPLTLITDRSPAFFSGAAVGGVYSAGPYSPESDTLLFLPTPPPSFDADQQASFFRDFNHHFNVMITPHELMPGHYLQLKWAAQHPSKIRAMFGDSVTIEGWGTYAERLMLDLGWGDELAYAAHLKKRLENTARTIVDIRVHTLGMEQDEVERFVVEEALQEEQFARNMRRRTLTTAPQLVTYFLGSREIERAYDEFLTERGMNLEDGVSRSDVDLATVREFTDGVMVMGPVPLAWWRDLLGAGS